MELFLSEINRVIKKPGKLILGLPLEKGYQADKDHCNFYTPKNSASKKNNKNYESWSPENK